MIEVSAEDFQKQVVDESFRRPVLVDFWAEWCGPCRVLGPLLENLEKSYQNKFLLVKVDTEKHQALAQQFQISSIPAVKLVNEGKIVDEFVGALPEEQIRAFLDKHITSDELDQVIQLAAAGKYDETIALIEQHQLSGEKVDEVAWQAIIDAMAKGEEQGKINQRLELIATYGSKYSDQKKKVADFFGSDPSPKSLKHLGMLFTEGTQEKALDYFLEQVSNAEDKDKAKAELFAAFAIIGDSDPLVMSYRKKLASLLF